MQTLYMVWQSFTVKQTFKNQFAIYQVTNYQVTIDYQAVTVK